MKMLVTGGNRGLGKHLVEEFGGTSISRANGIDITRDVSAIATMSLDYDVFVNNAFDGPPQEAWANFAQSQVYFAVKCMASSQQTRMVVWQRPHSNMLVSRVQQPLKQMRSRFELH